MKKAITLSSLILLANISNLPGEFSVQFSNFINHYGYMESTIGHGVAILLILSAGYSIAKNFMLNKEEQESQDGVNN